SYSDGFTSVGIGETVAISDESDSSETINRAWRNLVDKTTIHNPYEKVGSGMLAMGGLAFDPKKEKTSLWENYPAYELIVPKVSITQAEVTGGAFIDYVAKRGSSYSFELAESFARERSGGKVTYTNPIAVKKNGGWRYRF